MNNSINIVDIVRSCGVDLSSLNKKDEIYRGYCPFHQDFGTPNFTVYAKTNSWYCYACNMGGNAIKFLMKYYDISYNQAIDRLFDNNILENMMQTEEDPIDYNNTLNKILSKYFYNCLKNTDIDKNKIMIQMKKLDNLLKNVKITDSNKLQYYINLFKL